MPKSNFNEVATQLYWNRSSAWLFSFKFAAYCQNIFSQEHIWRAASEISLNYAWKTDTFFLKKYLFWTKASMSLNKESSSYSDLFC